jgi:hypothetical protein
MTKSEFYKALIEVQKSTGQGTTDFVIFKDAKLKIYLDEFIKEGLMRVVTIPFTHLPDSRYIVPTTGYCVWGYDDVCDKNTGWDLSFVRMFLGQTENITTGVKNTDANGYGDPYKMSLSEVLQDPIFMKGYSEWLDKNMDQLNIMLNLDETYKGPDASLSDDCIDWVMGREWYTSNETIRECINRSNDAGKNEDQIISLTKQMISLCSRSSKPEDEVKYVAELEEVKKVRSYRNDFEVLYSDRLDERIQDVIKK